MVESWSNRFYSNANDAWEGLYEGLCTEGEIVSPRGKRVKETLGCNIYISDVRDNLVKSPYRGLSPIYMAREYNWYKGGSRDPKDAPNSKFWQSIANKEDGLINSNYGAYVFVNQDYMEIADGRARLQPIPGTSIFDRTVKILQDDPDSRQAIIQIPIMQSRGKKDTPCTSHIQFFIRKDSEGEPKLFANVYMRSCDICCGFPYDIFQFTMWQLELAHALDINPGWMRFMAGSLHVYEEDWIENRGKFFKFKDLQKELNGKPLKLDEDKMSCIFLSDLDELVRSGSHADLVSEELKFMLSNMKIWKRKEW